MLADGGRRPRRIAWALLLAALAASTATGMLSGAVAPGELWDAIAHDAGSATAGAILWQLRLPRVALGLLVGAALGVSGAAFQGLFRNPLAEPYLLGAASGAALGATAAMTLLGGALHGIMQAELVPAFAFAGAALAVAVALSLAGGAARTTSLILAGVVVGAVLTGMTTLVITLQPPRLQAVFAFTLGSLALASWDDVRLLSLYLVLAMPALLLMGRALNALQLGDDVAATLGLRVRRLRLVVIGAATLATAAAVSQVGVIGFVGLVVPHALRRWLGDDYRVLIAGSALGGAALLVSADALARLVARPSELPVGVVTTLIGGPFFLYLLRRHRERL